MRPRAVLSPRALSKRIDKPATLRKHRGLRERMTMKLAWTGAALVAMASAGLLEKSAVAADVPIAVLGIEATEAPDALAASITEALRQRVTATKGFRLVPGRDLVE